MTETLPVYHTANSIQARVKVLNDIPRERARQEKIHPEKLTILEMFTVLVEEVGEVGTALQNKDNQNLYEELIQVSASAARMAEQILKKKPGEENL